jgi:hypothetical protein
MSRKTTLPITTSTKKVTTTTETVTTTTVETVEVKTIYLPFSCSFDGTAFAVESMTSIVTRDGDVFDVLVGRDDTTVLRIVEPTLNGVAATFRVSSNSGAIGSLEWTHGEAGFDSPAFPDAATVKLDITATIPAATGGGAGVAVGDNLAEGAPTEKVTTLIVVIRKPGLGDPVLTGG